MVLHSNNMCGVTWCSFVKYDLQIITIYYIEVSKKNFVKKLDVRDSWSMLSYYVDVQARRTFL